MPLLELPLLIAPMDGAAPTHLLLQLLPLLAHQQPSSAALVATANNTKVAAEAPARAWLLALVRALAVAAGSPATAVVQR